MNQIFHSPQSIIKAGVSLVLNLVALLFNTILTLLTDLSKNSNLNNSITQYLVGFTELTTILLAQITAGIHTIINIIINTDQLNKFYTLSALSTTLPSSTTFDFEHILEDETDGNKLIPVDTGFDCTFNVTINVYYFSRLASTGELNRKASQILKYKFDIVDQAMVDKLDDLIVVPELLDFEDKSPQVINGTTVPSPLNNVALHIQYLYTSIVGTDVVYDPLIDTSFPTGLATLKGIHLKVKGKFDRSDFVAGGTVAEKLKTRGNITIECHRVPKK